ncbi:MAG: nuclear transport factor 2 family protein [Acidobacteriota bacterium]
MTATNSKATSEAQIRKLIDDQARAVRAKDIDGSVSNYAPDIVSFDVVTTLQKIGLDACRKRAEEWFSSFQGPIGYELRDLNITAGDDVAFCHSLNRVNGTRTDGGKIDMWWRATVCFRKIDGKWMVTHEHSSVPFDVETGKASLDLKP